MNERPDDSIALREAVIATARAMNASGINVNKSGNVSVRCRADRARASCSRQPAFPTTASLPTTSRSSTTKVMRWVAASRRPNGASTPRSTAPGKTSKAVVHTHSPYATALACQGLSIPAFHYMVAVAGGADIRCAEYATFGTQALADNVLAALRGTARLPARAPRRDRVWRTSRIRLRVGCRSREPGPHLRCRPRPRRTPIAAGRGDEAGAGTLPHLRPACARRDRSPSSDRRLAPPSVWVMSPSCSSQLTGFRRWTGDTADRVRHRLPPTAPSASAARSAPRCGRHARSPAACAGSTSCTSGRKAPPPAPRSAPTSSSTRCAMPSNGSSTTWSSRSASRFRSARWSARSTP